MEKSAVLDALVEDLKAQGHLSDERIAAGDVGAISLDSLNLDSLDVLQFSINIEEQLGVEIDADHIPMTIRLAELADMILVAADK